MPRVTRPVLNGIALALLGMLLGCTQNSESESAAMQQQGSAGASAGAAADAGSTGNAGVSNGGSGNSGGAANVGGASSGQAGATAGGAGNSDAGAAGGAGNGDAGAANTADAGNGIGVTCSAVSEVHPSEGALHVQLCSQVSYGSNPPSSGNHYPTWAAFGVYEFALPRGFWLHNMEHGAVVISYNCPDGCDAELAAAVNWFNALPVDDLCLSLGSTEPRALLVPDPALDVRFAASSWLHTLRAECFDEAAFTAFYEANVGNGLEPVCTSGTDFETLGATRPRRCPRTAATDSLRRFGAPDPAILWKSAGRMWPVTRRSHAGGGCGLCRAPATLAARHAWVCHGGGDNESSEVDHGRIKV